MKLLDVREASTHTKTPVSTLNKMRVTGGGPRFLKKGRRIAYDAADLDKWLEGLKRTSTADPGPAASRRRRRAA